MWRSRRYGTVAKVEAVGKNNGAPYSDFVVVSRDGRISVTDIDTLISSHEEI